MIINKFALMEEESGADQGGGSGTPPDEQPTWNYAENTPGAGDRPEWFKEKYTSVEAQAQAYNDLEGRFGGFTGSPEEYADIDGFNADGEAGIMLATIKDIAKESNMNQATFEKIVQGISTNIDGYRETMQQEKMDAAIAEIPNFENRRAALAETAQANLTTSQFDGINELMTTVAGFEAVEALTAQIRGASLPGGMPAPQVRDSKSIMSDMAQLQPNDLKGRNALIAELNKNSNGKGTLT